MTFILYSPDAANEYAHPRSITDRKAIEAAIQDGSPDKIYGLIDDAKLNSDDLLKISELSSELDNYDWWLAINPNCPTELLERFLTNPDERIVSIALQHSRTSFEKFRDAVMNGAYSPKGRFSVESLENFAYSEHAFKTLEVFEKLWEKQRLKKSLILSAASVEFRNNALVIDPAIINFLAKRIANENNALRVEYARSSIFGDPAMLDLMKTDSHRPVITALAWNRKASVSTHEYILDNHKSISIKDGIAWASSDNDLLNRVYRSTKSEQTLWAIRNNPDFTKLS
jgi:hypothetical protein